MCIEWILLVLIFTTTRSKGMSIICLRGGGQVFEKNSCTVKMAKKIVQGGHVENKSSKSFLLVRPVFYVPPNNYTLQHSL